MKVVNVEALIAEARRTGDLAPFNRAVPYLRYLGVEIHRNESGPVLRLPFQEKLIGNPELPALHGGITGALLESAAIALVILQIEAPRMPKIVNITVDYLRPGRPQDTFAWGRITRAGRRIVSVQTLAWQSARDNPIATASARFLII